MVRQISGGIIVECPRCGSRLFIVTNMRQCSNSKCSYVDWIDWTETYRVHNMMAGEMKEKDELKKDLTS